MFNLKKIFKHKPRILIFINLIQDLDLLLPLAAAFGQKPDIDLEVVVTEHSWKESPRIQSLLIGAGIKPKRLPKAAVIGGLQPSLAGVKALITASESTCGPHRAAHELTKRANKNSIPTYTLQHGLENVGLTYSDSTYPIETVRFASQEIFTWGELDTLHPDIPEETRSKCIPVGCPKYTKQTDAEISFPHSHNKLVAIFENLHWERYDESYRRNFLADVNNTARQFSQTIFLLKPHHAGRWLTDKYDGELPNAGNLVIANPLEPQWESFTAPALLNIADAAITTPSTVAMDAARLQKPVAVVGYDLNLLKYQPLPILRRLEEWLNWVDKLDTPEEYSTLKRLGDEFLARQTVPGNATLRIIEHLAKQIFPI